MAIKDQCINCKSFNENVCLLTNVAPSYNQTSCEQYTKKGIILDKGNSSSPIAPQPTNNSTTEPISVKQGMFSHPFSFSGRIRRLEYFMSGILAYVYALLIGFLVGASGGNEGAMYLFLIPAYWFIWAQGAKRCHDRGNSGWYQLIPFYGLWMLFGDGDEFENEYGPDPKGRNINR
ncbi:MAG: DUF805 domain-containing protein [Muribaculaceae bacterium]|nr:DUF805 domain-containing protein [Muribaculaceae bacterium]